MMRYTLNYKNVATALILISDPYPLALIYNRLFRISQPLLRMKP